MARTLLIMSALLTVALPLRAATKAQADSLYVTARYEAAIAVYQQLLDPDDPQADLYYNLGNCYYKQDDVPRAILFYERALAINPSDADIRANLALARTKTTDKQAETSEMFFVTWWKQFSAALSLPTWAILAVCAFVLLLAGLLLCVFLTDASSRRWCLRAVAILFAVCLLSNLALLTQYNLLARHDSAIVMASSLTVKSSPDDRSTDLFIVHEGTKLRILDDSMTQWLEVRLEEGKQGWIPRMAIEII